MALLSPGSEDEVLDMVRAAVAGSETLELVGGGTWRHVGRPVAADHRLDFSALSGIRSYEPEELVLTVRPGTKLALVESVLAERRQHLAFEPPRRIGPMTAGSGPTIGGVIAGNLAGPRRLVAGAVRDHLLGFAAVNGRGERFKAGGRVVKNVTGFDLSKLIAGSWGTLAALTEVTLKVLPGPPATATLAIDGLDAETAGRAMRAAVGAPHQVTGAAWLDGSAWLRLEGPAPSVAGNRATLAAAMREFGAPRWLATDESLDLWRRVAEVPFPSDDAVSLWKVSVPPAAGPAVIAATAPVWAMLDWAGGLVWLALPGDGDGGAGQVRAASAAAGGHATLVHGEAALRARIDPFEPVAGPLAALTARVKDAFDPLHLFNPGRLHRGM
jgi:glycolate oxidase FAD binding subunit